MGRVMVRALLAFDDVRPGDEAWVAETPRVAALEERGFVAVLAREPDPDRLAEGDAAGDEQEEADQDGPTGAEHP